MYLSPTYDMYPHNFKVLTKGVWVEGFRLGLDGVQDTGLETPLYALEEGVWMHLMQWLLNILSY